MFENSKNEQLFQMDAISWALLEFTNKYTTFQIARIGFFSFIKKKPTELFGTGYRSRFPGKIRI